MSKTASRATTKSRARAAQTKAAAVEPDGLWSIAMLRIAMELKRPGAASLEKIVDGVVSKMGIPKAQFEKYLAEHIGVVTQTVGKPARRS